VGSDDDIIQLTKKHAPVMIPLAQNPSTKLKNFFYNLNYTTPPLVITGFEQHSSSICCRVMAGQSLPWKGKLCLFWKVLN